MPEHKLFIGHIPPGCNERDLEKFFKSHGFSKTIKEFVVKTGYGFVVFDDKRDADDAIYELNNKDFMGSRIQVEYAKPTGRSIVPGGRSDFGYRRDDSRDFRGRDSDRDRGRDRRDSFGGGGRSGGGGGGFRSGPSKFGAPYNTDYKIIIDNVSSRCSWQDIKDYFRRAGEVTFAKCHRERMGQGVVEFANESDMKNALRTLDDTELFGKRIRLRSSYHGGRSRSRSRSASPVQHRRSSRRSPSRSRSRSPR